MGESSFLLIPALLLFQLRRLCSLSIQKMIHKTLFQEILSPLHLLPHHPLAPQVMFSLKSSQTPPPTLTHASSFFLSFLDYKSPRELAWQQNPALRQRRERNWADRGRALLEDRGWERLLALLARFSSTALRACRSENSSTERCRKSFKLLTTWSLWHMSHNQSHCLRVIFAMAAIHGTLALHQAFYQGF